MSASCLTDNTDDETTIIKKDRKRKKLNPLVQKSSDGLKSRAVKSPDSDEEDIESVMVSYRSKRVAGREGPSDMGATAVLEIETEVDKDAQAIFENALKINKVTV
ncbi:unnamed protein product, partial [Timema podura]|nr:unnamed protein product [Timema podura]